MSSGLSFRERLERQADTSAKSRDPSSIPAEIEIAIGASFDAPISLALLLRDNGLGLSDAHAAVTELAKYRRIALVVFPRSLPTLLADLGRLGLVARASQPASPD